ncbi:flagellar motor protein MotA [Geobacter pickeringii]|uniref:Flagellar motor protein MotA n=2 Tax=Geobacter pickeringii TaxID=345632 RepID=A0A0B5B927_9BACT|nr:flagellar motor protein MotA [Geobacter pickeringii]
MREEVRLMKNVMKVRWSRPLMAAVAALTMLHAVSAHAWWEKKWEFRKKIAFDLSDKGAGIKENLADVPVLVRLHAGNFDFTKAKDDGSDLRFMAADDKSPLKFHIEKYDPKQAIALIWVRVPQLAGGGTQDSILLYYGNKGAPAAADAGGTYDTGQVAVFHFGEKEGAPHDATAYGNHGADFAGKLGNPAVIGSGATFNGTSDRLVIKRSPSLNFAKGFTFSAWAKPASAQPDARLFSFSDGKQGIEVGIAQGSVYARVDGATTGRTPAINPQSWHHVAVTAEPGKRLVVYLDGREAATANLGASMPSPTADLVVGGTQTGGALFAGEMDEVEISSVARPAAWFTAAVAGQGEGGKLTAYQQEEKGGGGSEDLTIHLMKVIARSITLDGWLVIGLCSFMLVWGILIFIRKFFMLQKISKSNKYFMESFGELEDPLALEEDEGFSDSSLFRVYQAGFDEIQRWVDRQDPEKDLAVLPRSILHNFRATLDRASTTESHKLSAWMLVLTLGISGGPFWGLLGTVWGVMNTFASLAESGEANLSAIAPGVASALACTLFGLFVAIPCLFAYTYLANQMKYINAANRHFTEEYAIKVEGAYGGTQ